MTTRDPKRRISRSLASAAWGLLLSAGAPAGLFIVRVASGRADPRALGVEWAAESLTYLYVVVSTAIVFAGFGGVLGKRADALARLATLDSLTGLLNRRAATDRLEAEVRRSLRYGDPLAAIALDLDGLKGINDEHGHAAGDAALRGVGAALGAVCRASDIVSRWGGDEFLVLAPGSPASDAQLLAERMREAVKDLRGDVPLSVSVGIGALVPTDTSPQPLLRRADAALYEAKRRGRDQVVVVSPG